MRIEDIIKKQKNQLDLESPPTELWDRVKSDWKTESIKETAGSFQWWKIAAMVFISTSIALLLYSLSLQSKVNQLASLGDISSEYQVLERQYQNEIASLEVNINIQEVSTSEDLSWIVEEMKTLEEINNIYRRDIGRVPDQNELVKALVDYYEKKIKLLKKLELEINRTQKFNNDEKGNTDTISI
ncbi:MAG: hypothetical protein ABJP45_01575 [Cyclobacteriaceae bacterium]